MGDDEEPRKWEEGETSETHNGCGVQKSGCGVFDADRQNGGEQVRLLAEARGYQMLPAPRDSASSQWDGAT